MPSLEVQKERLGDVLAGKVVNSDAPGEAMRSWRDKFDVTQTSVAEEMGVSPHIVSDYERGRRENPGANMVSCYISALLDVAADEDREVFRYWSSKYQLKERRVDSEPPT